MAEIKEIIIDVEVNAGESAQKLAEVKKNIADLKKEQKQLQDFIRAGADTTGELSARYAENAASLKALTAEEKMYTAQLNIATQGEKQYGDSLVEMSAQLAKLKSEYRGMTAAQREAAGGQELLKQIQDMDKALKDADASMGDHQRNVGNYASALLGLNGNVVKVATLFQGGFKQGLAAAGSALKSFGKAIIATPLGWILAAVAAVVAIFKKLVDAFRQNDDAMTAFNRALATLRPVLDAVNKLFSLLAEGVAKVVDVTMKAVTAVLRLVPAFREASDAARDLVDAQDKLEDKERDYVVNSAERQKQIAELKKKERGDEKLTLDEREAMLKEIDDLEKSDAEEKKALAEERYRIRKEEIDRKRKLNDDEKNELAQLRADMLKTETDYINATTRIAARQANVRKEKAKEDEAAAERSRQAWRKAQQERQQALKQEEDELRKLQDMRIAMIEDEYQRERAAAQVNYDGQIEDIKKRLSTEKNITVKTRDALNQQIMLLEAQKVTELQRIDKQHDDWLKKQDEDLAKWEEQQFEQALQHVAKAGAEAMQKRKAKWEAALLDYSNGIQKRLNEVYGSVTKIAEIELEEATSFYKSLVDMDKTTKNALYSTEAEYTAAVLKAEAEMLAARERNEQAMQQQVQQTAETLHAMTSAIGDLYGAISEDAEQYEKFKKALAIVDAVISLAQTIAAATSASTAGDPYTMALRIAANVAAVVAQFATVISSLKSATIPSAGSYSAGGIVPGDQYTGDRMTANVNSGEMILTKAQQQRLFDLIASGVPVSGFDYDRLAAAVVEGMKAMPSPVLDYRELVMFGRKIDMIERKTMK